MSGKSAYEIARENGFTGTQLEWLQSLVGGSGGITSIQKTGTDGANDIYTITYSDNSTSTFSVQRGTDGREIELQANSGTIQWRYVGQSDTEWQDLLTVDGSNVTFSARNGREIELRENTSTGYIQWHYVGDATWINLMPLSDITGNDGRDIEFDIQQNNLMWRYVTEYSVWHDLGTAQTLIPGVDTLKAVEYRKNGSYIQWRYQDGSSDWKNLITVESLTGSDYINIELQTDSDTTMLQWRTVTVHDWASLGLASELRGADGRDVALRVSDEYVQWQYVGDADWTNLMELANLQGIPGAAGQPGEAGRGIVSMTYAGHSSGKDAYLVSYSDGGSDTIYVTSGVQSYTESRSSSVSNGQNGQNGRDANVIDGSNTTIDNNVSNNVGGSNVNNLNVTSIEMDENGNFVFTTEDGKSYNVYSSAGVDKIVEEKTAQKNKYINILWWVAVLSLLWNGVTTVYLFIDKKKSLLNKESV